MIEVFYVFTILLIAVNCNHVIGFSLSFGFVSADCCAVFLFTVLNSYPSLPFMLLCLRTCLLVLN